MFPAIEIVLELFYIFLSILSLCWNICRSALPGMLGAALAGLLFVAGVTFAALSISSKSAHGMFNWSKQHMFLILFFVYNIHLKHLVTSL